MENISLDLLDQAESLKDRYSLRDIDYKKLVDCAMNCSSQGRHNHNQLVIKELFDELFSSKYISDPYRLAAAARAYLYINRMMLPPSSNLIPDELLHDAVFATILNASLLMHTRKVKDCDGTCSDNCITSSAVNSCSMLQMKTIMKIIEKLLPEPLSGDDIIEDDEVASTEVVHAIVDVVAMEN